VGSRPARLVHPQGRAAGQRARHRLFLGIGGGLRRHTNDGTIPSVVGTGGKRGGNALKTVSEAAGFAGAGQPPRVCCGRGQHPPGRGNAHGASPLSVTLTRAPPTQARQAAPFPAMRGRLCPGTSRTARPRHCVPAQRACRPCAGQGRRTRRLFGLRRRYNAR